MPLNSLKTWRTSSHAISLPVQGCKESNNQLGGSCRHCVDSARCVHLQQFLGGPQTLLGWGALSRSASLQSTPGTCCAAASATSQVHVSF